MIEEAVIHLIMSHQKKGQAVSGLFYSELLNQMNRIITTDIPTAGVNVTDKINLYVNPHFWRQMDVEEQSNLLQHELRHIMFDHLSRWKELNPEIENTKTFEDKLKAMSGAQELNMAADYAINEYLPGLIKDMKIFDKDGKEIAQGRGCFVEDLEKQMQAKGVKVERRETMDYYYNFLKQQKQNQGNKGKKGKGKGQPGQGEGDGDGQGDQDGHGNGPMVIDDHSLWGEGGATKEEIKERIKNAVNRAAEVARQAGRLPGDIEMAIERLNHKPKNWKQDLKKFVGNCIEVAADSSRKVRNRRFGLMFPGIKKYPKLNLALVIDTSGSIRDEEIAQMFAEIDRIHKDDVVVTVIECDAEVKNVFEFNPKAKIKIKGRGGTAFQPALDKATELKVDGLIYLTDGANFDTLTKPKYPVLWAILEGFNPPNVKWGYRTTFSVNKK